MLTPTKESALRAQALAIADVVWKETQLVRIQRQAEQIITKTGLDTFRKSDTTGRINATQVLISFYDKVAAFVDRLNPSSMAAVMYCLTKKGRDSELTLTDPTPSFTLLTGHRHFPPVHPVTKEKLFPEFGPDDHNSGRMVARQLAIITLLSMITDVLNQHLYLKERIGAATALAPCTADDLVS